MWKWSKCFHDGLSFESLLPIRRVTTDVSSQLQVLTSVQVGSMDLSRSSPETCNLGETELSMSSMHFVGCYFGSLTLDPSGFLFTGLSPSNSTITVVFALSEAGSPLWIERYGISGAQSVSTLFFPVSSVGLMSPAPWIVWTIVLI